jgi:hypothetical protein
MAGIGMPLRLQSFPVMYMMNYGWYWYAAGTAKLPNRIRRRFDLIWAAYII